MSEGKPVRLPQAAKEFNVGAGTIVETLQKKGFEVDNSPITKLTPEMMDVLRKEFKVDIDLKEKAAHVEFGGKKHENIELKSSDVYADKKKNESEEIRIKVNAPASDETEIPETNEKPKLEGPKIVGTIDLSPKKLTKEPPKEVEKPVEKKEEEPKIEEVKEAEKPVEKKVEEPEMIETKRINLEGFKIMGKIELPTEVDRKSKKEKEKEKEKEQKANQDKRNEDRKRKRKRIVRSKDEDKNQQQGKDKKAKPKYDEPPVISEKEIEEKLKATMARITGGSSKTNRSKIKRAKRAEVAEEMEKMQENEQGNVLQLTEFISVNELANLMNVPVAQVISTCMGLGVIVSINQRLDAEIIELVASEFNHEVKFISAADEEVEFEEDDDGLEDSETRPPIVTIMGHVDHGKTSLLDFIREANVVAKEAGGITQHIGAYDVTTESGKKICFLDTPGHEAFTAMRARGAKMTDIAVIVIAADDQIMPQTKEAISHAQSAGVPMIFALNKIDKEGANPDKIREQLANMNLLVEEWGGKYQCQEISAKTGLNVDLLLEKILIEAELMDLKANPEKRASGSVIEASLDKGRGYVSTLLVQNGTLHIGDIMVCGQYFGKVKAMFNHLSVKQDVAGPSVPVQVLGLNGAPQAGEMFRIFENDQDAKSIAYRRAQLEREQGIRTKKHITLDEIGRRLALGNFKELNIIVKGDVDGSVEALTDSLLKLSTEEIQVNVLHKGVGQINETDVLLASASDAIIIGFQVRPSMQARKLAEGENIEVRTYSVIYAAIDDVKAAMEGLLEPKVEEKITAMIEVKEAFKITNVGTIAGCMVIEGKVKRDNKVRLTRDGIVLFTGELASLKRYKDDVKDVVSGQECGLNLKNFNDIKAGDLIEAFEEIEVKRKL